MFSGFKLHLAKEFFEGDNKSIEEYIKIGKENLVDKKAIYEEELKKYIDIDTVDGTKLQDDWFPQIKADIFISHSHIDESLAQALAGWLNYNFNLTCFIDSDVWGYCDKLLYTLNDRYSNKRRDNNGGNLYDYQSANKVSQHVNMMLSVALQKMIDKTEAVILLNTDNSINMHEKEKINFTYSPWIYSEIICTEIVRKKSLLKYRKYNKVFKALNESTMQFASMQDFIKISYDVHLGHLNKLDLQELKSWKQEWSEKLEDGEYALDVLYRIKKIYPSDDELIAQLAYLSEDSQLDNINLYPKVYNAVKILQEGCYDDLQYEKCYDECCCDLYSEHKYCPFHHKRICIRDSKYEE